MMVYIYALVTENEPNNIRYIGKTNNLNKRLKRHLSAYYLKESTYKSNWIKSELIKNNSIKIIEIDKVSEEEWQYWEKYWIEQFKQWGFILTNGTKGGEGLLLTEENLKRRNDTNIERNKERLSEEIEKYKIVNKENIWFGYRNCPSCSEEVEYKSIIKYTVLHNARRAEIENRICNSCKSSGDKNYFYGKKINDGELKKEKYGKKVFQYDLDNNLLNEYKSIREASEILGIDRKSISNCCRGIKHFKTAGGFKFKFE